MAKGRPDYFSGVDIAYQALSQVIVRQKYGVAVQAAGVLEAPPNERRDLFRLSGKGIIYGGSVWLDHTSSQADGEIHLFLDATIISSPSFLRMNDYGMVNPRSSVITLNKYDATNYIYSAGLSFGLTFELSFAVAYREYNGGNPTVHYNLVYALI